MSLRLIVCREEDLNAVALYRPEVRWRDAVNLGPIVCREENSGQSV